MRTFTVAVLMALGLSTGGCTTSLSTSSETLSVSSKHAARGIPYSLPMLQYDVKITRALSQCSDTVGTGQNAQKVKLVQLTVKAEAVPHFVAGETFSIDYEKLGGFSKTTSLAIENHEGGTLKSINASVDDRSAEIIGGAVKTLIGLASIAGGFPIPSAAQGESTQKMLVCTAEAEKLLDAVETASANLKTATGELTKITDRVTLLTEQAKANALSETGKQELLEKLKEQTAQTKAVAAAQTKANKAGDAVSATSTHRWPQASDQFDTFLELSDPDLRKLAKLLVQADLVAGSENAEENRCDTTQSIEKCVKQRLLVAAKLEALAARAAGTLDETSGAISPASAQRGLFVRPPVAGRLVLCKNEPNADCDSTSDKVLLVAPDAMIPQLGQLRFLPFKNEAFQNNVISLALRANGSIEKFEYKTLKAQGEGIATTAASAVGQLGGFLDARRTARDTAESELAAMEKSARDDQIALIEFEIEKLTKQRQLEQLSQPPTVTELATVKADAELADARRALYEALLAEREAKTALGL